MLKTFHTFNIWNGRSPSLLVCCSIYLSVFCLPNICNLTGTSKLTGSQHKKKLEKKLMHLRIKVSCYYLVCLYKEANTEIYTRQVDIFYIALSIKTFTRMNEFDRSLILGFCLVYCHIYHLQIKAVLYHHHLKAVSWKISHIVSKCMN